MPPCMAARSRPCRGKQVAREGGPLRVISELRQSSLRCGTRSEITRRGPLSLLRALLTEFFCLCCGTRSEQETGRAFSLLGALLTEFLFLAKLICGNRIPAALQTGGTAECASEDTSICRSPAPRRAKASECRKGPRAFWQNPSRGRRLALRVAGRCTEGTVLVRGNMRL